MSKIYTNGEFGVTEPKEIEDGLETQQLAKEKIRLAETKQAIKLGYDRIKTKAKEIRQNIENQLVKDVIDQEVAKSTIGTNLNVFGESHF